MPPHSRGADKDQPVSVRKDRQIQISGSPFEHGVFPELSLRFSDMQRLNVCLQRGEGGGLILLLLTES